MTIRECIAKLDEFPGKIGKKGEELCTMYCYNGDHVRTGELANSFYEKHSSSVVDITTDCPYAKYVVKGRGEVKPVFKKALSNNYDFGPVAHASAYSGDDFVKKAAKDLAAQAESIFYS